MPSWDADQYKVFLDDRTRPARDLLSGIECEFPRRVIDVGCGPGNSTALLLRRWPDSVVVGLDSSDSMLAAARRRLPDVEFVRADLRAWVPPAPVDVVYSNATLHWVEDHPRVFDHLLGWLAPGGTLAVQMPANHDQPSHTLMRRLTASPRWASRLGGVLQDRPVASPDIYYRMLAGKGRVDIWTTEYLHVLGGDDPVLEWVRGSALRPVLDVLTDEEADEFEAAYATALREAYPPGPDGMTLLPFRRVFIVFSGR